ncbi:hypothetical protein U9M48_037295 [Paspalum notatum var. saurae]|uniref:Uncharacterized protein n=1 Tax=Paspalum notatum var. saurae TaxID=547442 RepID=A0AAQ3XAX4_PASNO
MGPRRRWRLRRADRTLQEARFRSQGGIVVSSQDLPCRNSRQTGAAGVRPADDKQSPRQTGAVCVECSPNSLGKGSCMACCIASWTWMWCPGYSRNWIRHKGVTSLLCLAKEVQARIWSRTLER